MIGFALVLISRQERRALSLQPKKAMIASLGHGMETLITFVVLTLTNR